MASGVVTMTAMAAALARGQHMRDAMIAAPDMAIAAFFAAAATGLRL
jgi:hypothetical protein